MSSLRDFLIFRGRRAPEARQHGMPEDIDGAPDEGRRPDRSEYQPRITPTRPVRTAISIPQGIRHGSRYLASASKLDGYSNQNRPRR